MDYLDDAYLGDVHPAWPTFTATLKVDRSFSREVINYVGALRSPMKEVVSFDVIFYDRQGTRMLAKMKDRDVRDRFMRRIYPGATYEVTGLAVDIGGEGVHERFHLQFFNDTVMKDCKVHFPPLVYKLVSVYDISWRKFCDKGFFDVGGFVRYCSPVTTNNTSGLDEKEFFFILQSLNDDPSWANNDVVCKLRGSWVEAVENMLLTNIKEAEHVFVIMRYVVLDEPSKSGTPSVRSYCDASVLDIEPRHIQAQALRQKLMGNDGT